MTLKEIKAKATVSELLLIEQVELLLGDSLTEKDQISGEISGWKAVETKLHQMDESFRDNRRPAPIGALRAWIEEEIRMLSKKLK